MEKMKQNNIHNGVLEKKGNNLLKYDFFLDNSTDIIWLFDDDLKTLKVSKSIEKLTGYYHEDFAQLPIDKIISEKTIYSLKQKILINNFSFDNEMTLELFAKNKRKIYCDVIIEVVDEINGSAVYCIHINSSYANKLQDKLYQENEKNQLANKFKSSIVNIITHEFKTPLIGIIGYTKLLAKDTVSSDNIEMLECIYNSAQRLNMTLNSVTTLAALESEQYELNYEDVNVNEVLQNIYSNFIPDLSSKNIEFEIDCDIDLSIRTDSNCLYQILYHLIDNSFKFTNTGKIQSIAGIINVNGNKHLEIMIKDTGIGIDNNMIHSIYEPFRQASEGNDRKYDGLGIGLTITEKLVEALNGAISIESEVNKGTMVRLLFPVFIY